MLYTPITKLISVTVVSVMLFSCSQAGQSNEGLLANEQSSDKKYFKNLGVTMVYPQEFKEIEATYSYTFMRPDENEVYIAAIYPSQTSEQVVQIAKQSLSQNGFKISVSSSFETNARGLLAADAKTEHGSSSYPGYMIIRTMPNGNTYLLYGCATIDSEVDKMKSSLNEMASSIDISTNEGNTQNSTQAGSGAYVEKSVSSYQQYLSHKVLINSKRSNDIVSTEDWQQSHGRWVASEDVEKTRRFLLCGGGFGYFRFVTTGHQMTGDYGTVELDKFSGGWRIAADGNKIGIYMQDERDNRTRFWEINEITDKIVFIENRPYEVFTQEQGGNECNREGGVLVPQ